MNAFSSTHHPDTALTDHPAPPPSEPCMMDRRQFLLTSGAATFTIMVTVNAGTVVARQVPALVSTYPRRRITTLSALKQGDPISFLYPEACAQSDNILVKLGHPAGGGVGPLKDVVAFNHTCRASVSDLYKHATKSLGPCPHQHAVYDLARHGLQVAGVPMQSLPQVMLELDGDDIYAVGIFGLIHECES